MNGGWGVGFSTVIDVQGFNYRTPGIEKFHADFPAKLAIGACTIGRRAPVAARKARVAALMLPTARVRHRGPGFGGLEIHGADALLRSVVTLPQLRRIGMGTAIVSALEVEARARQCRAIYLLTASEAKFFGRLGIYLSTAEASELLDIYHLKKFDFVDWARVGKLRAESGAIDHYLDELAALPSLSRRFASEASVSAAHPGGSCSPPVSAMNLHAGYSSFAAVAACFPNAD